MNEVRTYSRAKTLVERRFYFVVHLSIFVPVLALLFFFEREVPAADRHAWIVLWSWGIGLAAHCIAVFFMADARPRTPLEETIRGRRMVFYLHLFVYLNTTFLCYFVNQVEIGQARDASDVTIWWTWPALFWGIGIFYHWFFTFVVRGWGVKKLKQRWTLKLMQQMDGVERPEKLNEPEQGKSQEARPA